MNPSQQDPQPTNNSAPEPPKPVVPAPTPPTPTPISSSPTQMAPDTAAKPPEPIQHVPMPQHAAGGNPMKIILPILLFVIFLVLGVGLALIMKTKTVTVDVKKQTPMTEAMPTGAPSPSPVVTKSPEESQLDTIDVGSSEAELNKVQKNIDQL